MASRSLSDEAALNRLKRLAGASRSASVEITIDNGAAVCAVRGLLSVTPDGVTVKGEGMLVVDLDSVNISSCKFEEQLSETPSTADAALDANIRIPFASFYLTNGTRVAFYRALLSKV
jgi:hypothetical protein